jgi:hypothetical protein
MGWRFSTSKDKLEEKFHNIEIRQDGDLGLVTFNYDFVIAVEDLVRYLDEL